jgi:hypothetical protein
MTLSWLVTLLRRERATLDQIDMVLALIEVDAWDTPYFAWPTDEERVLGLLSFIRTRNTEFQHKYFCEGTKDEFLTFLASHKEFYFDPNEVKAIIQRLQKQGEGTYGFTKIDRVDEGNP